MQVALRPLVKQDAQTSYKWRNNPEVWKYTGARPNKEITPEIETEWLCRVLQNTNEKRMAILADGTYVGNTYLTDICNDSAEFHIFIGDTKYWGHGVASMAMGQMLLIARNELGLNNITLSVSPHNTAAMRLYKRYGFVSIPQQTQQNRISMQLDLRNFNFSCA